MVTENGQGDIDYDGDYRPVFHDFYDLIKWRVGRILLVSSLYDAFTLEEDGLLFEKISSEYSELSLPFPPQLMRVSSGTDALEELSKERYDLVITMAFIDDMDPYVFGQKAKEIQDVPVILLLTEMADIKYYHKPGERNGIDKVFFWNGDSSLYLAITKYLEDSMNIVHDTGTGLVRVILVIEDSPRFYSIFLPLIYTEIMKQTRELITEGLNEHEKRLRLRTRPKILMAETYEEAKEKLEEFRPYVMGIITDVRFPKDGKKDSAAGFQFVEEVADEMPTLIMSTNEDNSKRAEEMGIRFIDKNSDTMLQELRSFFQGQLGFGDFIFMRPDGSELDRAADVREFIDVVGNIPPESIRHHASEHHFSNWLMARGEITLATDLKQKRVSDFGDAEEIRTYLLDAIHESRRIKQLGIITDFEQQEFEFEQSITRLGGGSLGGKGRGLAFLSALLSRTMSERTIGGCAVKVPETLIIATDRFDQFMDDHDLYEFIEEVETDEEVKRLFLERDLPEDLRDSLLRYLEHVGRPIAVRSSSLLEDSQNQPFAGIYSTYILPNNTGDILDRLDQLEQAIKLVYASTFFKRAKAYLRSTGLIAEEEKMAVVIQTLVGAHRSGRFYPLISGVAQSYNFYPIRPQKRDDGVVSIALGLGNIVVEGGKVLSFSPMHPKVIPGFASTKEVLGNSQNIFFALNMEEQDYDLSEGEDVTLVSLPVEEAERDGALGMIASSYDANDDRLRPGPAHPGPKLVTFSCVLEYDAFPLVDIIKELLDLGRKGMGRQVEIEFAVEEGDEGVEFHILQIRPIVTLKERMRVEVPAGGHKEAFVYSEHALGNGVVEEIRDIICVTPDIFDRARTVEMARAIGVLNRKLGKPYLLMGPGRWGSQDRWLGIPVEWDEISNARAIVETSTEDLRADPSHGTHFFHNITSLGIPYLTVFHTSRTGHIAWDWLASQHDRGGKGLVHHIELDRPLVIKVDGRSGRGVILKHEGDEE